MPKKVLGRVIHLAAFEIFIRTISVSEKMKIKDAPPILPFSYWLAMAVRATIVDDWPGVLSRDLNMTADG